MSSTIRTTNWRRRQCSSASHFHCYLLRSLDPMHPWKTYIGFTIDPHRRLRQHNGILKSGGAWKTKKSGRPWEFVCIVHGFLDQRSGLQFEWAWQHCDKSLVLRNAIGDGEAKNLKRRKRGIQGQLHRLKALLTECGNDLYDTDLTVYFFDPKNKTYFENKIKINYSGLPFPKDRISLQCANSLEEMPFWNDREKDKLRRQKSKNNDGSQKQLNYNGSNYTDDNNSSKKIEVFDCILCSRPIRKGEAYIICKKCDRPVHEICADINEEDGDGLCPLCETFLLGEEKTSDSDDENNDDSIKNRALSSMSYDDECLLCSRPIYITNAASQNIITCNQCHRSVHAICAEIHEEDSDGLCPKCKTILLGDEGDFIVDESDDNYISDGTLSSIDFPVRINDDNLREQGNNQQLPQTKKTEENDKDLRSYSHTIVNNKWGDCSLCSRAIKHTETPITCQHCSQHVHEICCDIHKEQSDGLCPNCNCHLTVENRYSSSNSIQFFTPKEEFMKDTESLKNVYAFDDNSNTCEDDSSFYIPSTTELCRMSSSTTAATATSGKYQPLSVFEEVQPQEQFLCGTTSPLFSLKNSTTGQFYSGKENNNSVVLILDKDNDRQFLKRKNSIILDHQNHDVIDLCSP